jgi:hypothetical protein
MDQMKPSASQWTDRSALATVDGIERRIRELTGRFADGPTEQRNDALAEEVEVLVAAAFIDPVARTRRGDMPLSRALVTFQNSPPSDFKKVFGVDDYARDFDKAYELAIEVVGKNVALAMMEDVLRDTGDAKTASMLVIERMVSPTSRYRRFARAPERAAAPEHAPTCV